MITPEERAAARRRLAEARTDGTLAAALEELSASTDEAINDARSTIRDMARAEYDERVANGGVPFSIRDAFVAGALWAADGALAAALEELSAEGGS